ncbi:MAG: hypothetical protein ACREIP_03585 [Alphaproteobacteria bacterium]
MEMARDDATPMRCRVSRCSMPHTESKRRFIGSPAAIFLRYGSIIDDAGLLQKSNALLLNHHST